MGHFGGVAASTRWLVNTAWMSRVIPPHNTACSRQVGFRTLPEVVFIIRCVQPRLRA